MAQENYHSLSKSRNLEHTIDNELLAISRCDNYLSDLEDDAKIRVLMYLLDKHRVMSSRYKNMSIKSYLEGQRLLSKELDSDSHTEKIKKKNHLIQNKKKNPTPRKVISSEKKYALISSLNLAPKNNISLKEYYGQFVTKNNYENITVILSYLINELKEKKINYNHIYTCYKYLGLRVPALKQSIFDTKRRRGWINYSSRQDIRITVSGENYLDHDIERK